MSMVGSAGYSGTAQACRVLYNNYYFFYELCEKLHDLKLNNVKYPVKRITNKSQKDYYFI